MKFSILILVSGLASLASANPLPPSATIPVPPPQIIEAVANAIPTPPAAQPGPVHLCVDKNASKGAILDECTMDENHSAAKVTAAQDTMMATASSTSTTTSKPRVLQIPFHAWPPRPPFRTATNTETHTTKPKVVVMTISHGFPPVPTF